MHYEIKKIDIWVCGRFAGIFYGLIGLVPMIFGLGIYFFSRQRFDTGALLLALFPLGAFAGGFIIGSLFAWIYNVLAGSIGGIKLDIDYKEDTR